MLSKIGRLDSDDIKELDVLLDEIFKNLDKNQTAAAEKKLIKVSRTPNYFIREYVGKKLIQYKNPEIIVPIAEKMLKHKMYGVRAAAIFFFFRCYEEELDKLFAIVQDNFESVPWEVETIINSLWRKHPDFMKEKMPEWIASDNYKKRSLSFHGMENISQSDPVYIMNFISQAIDDDRVEVQKKITHILTQVSRSNPIVVFPYVREWLSTADDQRIKTIWVSMKKLANIVLQKTRKRQPDDFTMLTVQTFTDWRNDENEKVNDMGERLYRIINRH